MEPTSAEAWAAFYQRNRAALHAYALSLAPTEADAHDLLQDVLVQLVRRQPAADNPRAYVLRCLRHLAIDRRRAAGRRPEAVTLAQAPPLLAVPDDRLAERQRRLRDALLSLPDVRREIIVLKTYAELTFEEIATVLERPLGTVTSEYARGLQMLRVRLLPEEEHVSR
ncbi:MAG: sigma-70 family RNA polymerase sigma factor [Phycisphaerae bacterium]